MNIASYRAPALLSRIRHRLPSQSLSYSASSFVCRQSRHSFNRIQPFASATPEPKSSQSREAPPSSSSSSTSEIKGGSTSSSTWETPSRASTSSNESLPPGWEDEPDWNITKFDQLPHRTFGFNQHMIINEEFKESLRQILWQFRAPIRYAFAYGSGVFPQSNGDVKPESLSPHPHPPEAIKTWQRGGGKIIDFIFGVSFTEHWHSLNLHQHRDHYSALGSLGSGPVTKVQENWGAGVYFNPYITVNGTMIKYGVVNLKTLQRDLSDWDTLYLAGRLQKPVKILRDDPKVRLANQINLISAVRTALLMLPEKFTEKELYNEIASISYTGDPRIRFRSENPNKVSNIVTHQLPNFRLLYNPLIEDLPNVSLNDPRCYQQGWEQDSESDCMLEQDMDPVKRGNMVRRLPRAFREKLYFLYQGKFAIPGNQFNEMLEQAQDEDKEGFRRREGTEFDRRIAGEPDLREMVRKAIQQTVEWPSTSQSVKGFITAGVGRGWRYLQEKRQKSKQA
ncbi:mitochondrial import protein-like protein mmp37 [Eremomyces bilateralis CBS 781.70]|uniref:Phosphatidate cytidylyltransferase, mitochondrial n=1 Tax=Eremomyces bilateralis CBS 781.70 TaxID=1392243 RepID=A0A6G1GHQ4_9PEZI|nr:mitochondrial import protein-like protein mmp37 [Eremomyces bilateralis CBS 781.70]KAF1817583.1 mitochondrial import protein-like protein mmp37 [Eremomyces bilateralis CBS 781.70]